MKKRIGIIGLGSIAQKVYLPILSKHKGLEIAGILGRREDAVNSIGDQYRIRERFIDLKRLLKQDLEAVFVHSSTESHGKIVKECLEHGVNVYVDKPLSYSIEESYEMIKTAEDNKKLLAVGFNRRFAPMNLEAKLWMQEACGFSSCVLQKNRTGLQNVPAKHTIFDDLIHILDLLIWLGNDSFSLKAFDLTIDNEGRMLLASGILNFKNASGYFGMDRQAGVDMEKLEMHGNGRSVEVVNLEKLKRYDQKEGEHVKQFGSWDDILYRRGFVNIVDHFIESLDDNNKCSIRGDQVMIVHELAERLSK